LAKDDTFLKTAFISVVADGKELKKDFVSNFPLDQQLKGRHWVQAIRLHEQLMVDEYLLKQTLGNDYSKAKVILTVEATGLKPSRVECGKMVYGSPEGR